MKGWFWTQKSKETHFKFLKTIQRFGWYKYGISDWTAPTMLEMIKGIYYADFRSVFKNKEHFYWFDFHHGYYDGHHCVITIIGIAFYWYY